MITIQTTQFTAQAIAASFPSGPTGQGQALNRRPRPAASFEESPVF